MTLENKLAKTLTKKVLGPSLALGLAAATPNVGATLLSVQVPGQNILHDTLYNYQLTEDSLLFDFDFNVDQSFSDGVDRVVLHLGDSLRGSNFTYNFDNFECFPEGSDYLDCYYDTRINPDFDTNIFSGKISLVDPAKVFDIDKGLLQSTPLTFAAFRNDFDSVNGFYANVIDKPIVQEPPVTDVSAPTTLGIFGLALGGLALSRKWKPQVTSKYNSF
jgi:hypothetical protein